jgi:hypothetical protein
MPKNFRMMVLVGLLTAVPVAAQESGNGVLQEILQAARLPTVTREARLLGVPERDLQSIFATARERRVPAGSLAELFAEENDAIRKHGPIDNFGAFVQEKLAAGLRGRELAAAIHAEHAARGTGKGRPAEVGKPGAHPSSSGSVGKPGKPGKPVDADEHGGKPDSPGKSGEAGKKGGAR